MIFEQIASGGCRSYLVGCADSCAAALIDPELSQVDRYLALAVRHGLRIHYLIDTHTHADHFSATRRLARQLGVPLVMRLRVLHTPGHTRDSMCLVAEDRVFTGDTLLIGATGRTDLPSGDPEQLYDSLFGKLLKLDPALLVFPAHEYKGRAHTTLGEECAGNPRLQVKERGAFVELMRSLNLSMPTHLNESLRTNLSGGQTVAQLLADAAANVPFMALDELLARVQGAEPDLIVLDVRERDAFEAGHVPGAHHLPRGQLELRVNDELPDPTVRIIACCEFGRISTLAAATLRQLGFQRAVALDGGMKAWREAGYPVQAVIKA
jgi:glyoxylase-like metal-dependent hydrolase (beta-lactamase superfamily II)/rhodanese-related sulfurtransferase